MTNKLGYRITIKSFKEIKKTLSKSTMTASSVGFCPREGVHFRKEMKIFCGQTFVVPTIRRTSGRQYISLKDWSWAAAWVTVEEIGDGMLTQENKHIIEELDEMLKHHLEYNYLFNKALPLSTASK